MSKIEWTDTTWNPIRGCSIVSPGCTNCYAMKQAHRHSGKGGAYEGLTKMSNGGPVWTGEVRPIEAKLFEPLRWRKPRMVFANSMSDLFHEAIPFHFIDQVFAVMALSKHHRFQVLTKRADRMHRYLTRRNCLASVDWHAQRAGLYLDLSATTWPLPNVWIGVSAENQETANERIPLLLQSPAAARFVSYEPALEPVDFEIAQCTCPWPSDAVRTRHLLNCPADIRRPDNPSRRWSIDWIIAGGESGPGARPCDVWGIYRAVMDARAAGIPIFVKQLGAKPVYPVTDADAANYGERLPMTTITHRKGADMAEWPEPLRVREFPQ